MRSNKGQGPRHNNLKFLAFRWPTPGCLLTDNQGVAFTCIGIFRETLCHNKVQQHRSLQHLLPCIQAWLHLRMHTTLDEYLFPSCESLRMKGLGPSLSPSGAYADHNLLDSISEDDRAALLPIIKMAFPFLKCEMLGPFAPSEVDFSMQRRYSIMQTEENIMQTKKGHGPALSNDVHFHDCGSENRRHNLIQTVDDSMQMDESLSSPSISMDGFKAGQHHEVDILPYKCTPPTPAFTHLRQQHMMCGLQSMSCQPRPEARELDNMETTCPFKGQKLLYARTAEIEESCIITDEKLSLSLGSTPSETNLHMDAASSMTNLLAYTSPESSWLQQETSDGAAFPRGDCKRKRILNLSAASSLDLNSCTSHKSFESNVMHEDGVSETVRLFSLGANKRKSAPHCSGEYEQGSKRVQCAKAEDVNAQEETAMVVRKGCTDELNGCIPQKSGLETSFANQSPCGNMLAAKGCSDEPTFAHVAGSTNLDSTMEEHTLQQCRRSNGKQWRCKKNATPGTLYCELHHVYRSKRKIRKSVLPAKPIEPCIQRQQSQTPDTVQIELQRPTDGCSEQSSEAFVKKKFLDVARCRRSDGKLWQCSKQAMPGSTYCEDHHNRRSKKKKKQTASFLVAGKNKADNGEPRAEAAENGANASSGDGCCKHGQVKEENGLDQTLICSSESNSKREGGMQACYLVAKERTSEINVLEGCGGSMSIGAQSHEDGYCRKIMQLLQMGDVDGLVSAMAEHSSLHIANSDGMKNINGFGESTGKGGSHKSSWTAKGASSVDLQNAGCSGDINGDHHSSENGHEERCHRNDGKRWQCSEPCKPGFAHCQYHQRGQQKVRAGVNEQAKVEKPEKLSDEEAGMQGFAHNLDGTDCSAGVAHHNEHVRKKVEEVNDNSSQDVFSLKQCQRKYGKGWQCPEHAKQGYNYCEYHLVYPNHLLATQGKREISTANKLTFCSKACPSATRSIPKQGMSARDEHKKL